MLFRNFIFIFTFLSLQNTWAQKKNVDTVFIYEKVIVYDTVYIEKPIKKKINDVQLPVPTLVDLIIENRIFNTEKDKTSKKNFFQSFQYGVNGGIGFKNSSWAKELSKKKQQFGQNVGIWVSKSIIDSKLSLMLSVNANSWNSSFDLDANKEETYLDGFYFSENRDPLLFQRFNNKHLEYALQLKAIYEWKKIRPTVGFLASKNIYKMQFLVPENNVLNKLDDFKTNKINFGFSFGLQYRIFSRFLLDLEYQQYKIDNLSLKNSSFDFDIFKTNNTFAERKLNFGISYFISK